MNKMIVTIFENEKTAYQGLQALKDLHAEGSLTLHAEVVIAKTTDGQVSVKQADSQGPAGTILGLAAGSLIGLLAGPAGVALGATAGTITGAFVDLAALGVGQDFLAEVSQNLTPGKAAVVADADEEWVTPLDSKMQPLGGIVLRRARADYIDAQIEREAAADRAELAELKAEYKQATGEAKATIKARIDDAHRRLDAKRTALADKIEAFGRAGEARIKTLQAQAVKAKSEMKATLDKRIAEQRADDKVRVEKLRQAWQLVKDAAKI
jgi:uncharacterized membrane protein